MRFEERLWAKIDRRGPDECWPWTGSIQSQGYGHLGRGKKRLGNILAHRAIWEATHGPIPTGPGYHGTCVLHSCDNRRCCNPAHLFLGTQADNLADMRAKGRGPLNGTTKLTVEKVRRIRADGGTGRALARRFGVAESTISAIRHRRTWKAV